MTIILKWELSGKENAVMLKNKTQDNYGDQKVAAGIEQAIAEVLPKTHYTKPKRTVHFSHMYFLLQNGLNRKHDMEMKVHRLSDTDARLTFRILPYENEIYPPKLFVTVPSAHFSGLLEKVTVIAKHIKTFDIPEGIETVRFDKLDWNGFHLYGKRVADINADFGFTVPKSKGKNHNEHF